MVHENAPHHASGNREEMRAVVPRNILGVDEPQIRFIDQRRCLEAMLSTLSSHAPPRDLVKLALDERNQPAEGGFVALTPFQKQSGGVRGVVRNVAILSAFRPVHRFAAHSRSTGRRLACMSPGRSAYGALVFVGSVLAWNNESDPSAHGAVIAVAASNKARRRLDLDGRDAGTQPHSGELGDLTRAVNAAGG